METGAMHISTHHFVRDEAAGRCTAAPTAPRGTSCSGRGAGERVRQAHPNARRAALSANEAKCERRYDATHELTDLMAWGKLSQERVVHAMLAGLHAPAKGANTREACDEEPPECRDLLTSPPQKWCESTQFAANVHLMTGLAWAERAGHEVVQTIAELRGLATAWLRPPDRWPRMTAAPVADLLFHMEGWSYAILLTRAQANGMRREAQWARRRLAAWPWQLARRILTPGAQARAGTADWIQAQARVLTHATCHAAVVYAMKAATTV